MVDRIHQVYKAPDRSYLAIVKREIHTKAVSAGFSERRVGEIDIVVSEICTNIIIHGGGGEILVRLIEEKGIQGIELISIDSGPGMSDVNKMMTDGVSTKNTLGQGLGAIKRLSDFMQVYSQKDWGTVLLARIYNEPLPYQKKKDTAGIHTLLVAKPNETHCGDGFHSFVHNKRLKMLLGDGLGHGPQAEKAVLTAIEAFKNSPDLNPAEAIRNIHTETKKTRGLVATVAEYDFEDKTWSFCGVGNISTRINSPDNFNAYLPYNGIIGMNTPTTLTARTFKQESNQYILMFSDGLKSRFDNNRLMALQRYDFSVMAAALYKDLTRRTDDVSVVICKINT